MKLKFIYIWENVEMPGYTRGKVLFLPGTKLILI